jgi:hypothetical protein
MAHYGKYKEFENKQTAQDLCDSILTEIRKSPVEYNTEKYLDPLPDLLNGTDKHIVPLVKSYKNQIIEIIGQDAWDNAPYLQIDNPYYPILKLPSKK